MLRLLVPKGERGRCRGDVDLGQALKRRDAGPRLRLWPADGDDPNPVPLIGGGTPGMEHRPAGGEPAVGEAVEGEGPDHEQLDGRRRRLVQHRAIIGR